LDLLSVEEFNKSVPGKKLLQHASESGTEYHSLEDFGIQVSGTAWYYYIATDSISYHCLLLPLSSAARFEQFFNKEGKDNIVHNGARRSMVTPGSDHFLLWDDQSALLISGSLNDRFFRDSANAERYGVKEVSYSDYYYRESEAPYTAETVTVDTAMAYDATTDVATAVEEAPEEKPEPPMPVEVAPVEEKTPEPDIAGEPTATDPGQIEPPPPPVSYSNHNTSAYNKAYEEQRKIKKDLAQKWTAAFAENKFGNSTTTSILNNPAYQRSQDKEAVATFYLSDLSGLYSGILPYYYGRYTNGVLSGFKSMNARLYLDREEARVVSELEVDENKATSYKKMYSKKVNKKFLKYINSDKLIGFMSYAINTEAYLQEVPGLLENTYGRYLDKYEEEIGLGAELFSLLLDE
ncbi:MAG TPA: hypothetical protein VFS31_14125, partial [Chitinophagaceae bacterium]|nr:hypothetical protein [Chitinophagaceae bacterium]